MPPATTIAERRTKIDRYLDTALERADERPLAAVSTMEACPDRWYGQLMVLSYNAIADEPRTDAILPASAAIELLRGYCRLRSELFVQLADDFAHSLTRDPAAVLLAGDYLNSAAYTVFAETDYNQLEDAFHVFTDVSESLVEAFDTEYIRSVDDYSFLDETAGSLGEGAAIIGATLAGVNTFQRADFATLGRGFSTAFHIRRNHSERHRLGGGVLGLSFLASAGVLGDEHAARDGNPHAQRDEQEHHREREADGGERVGAVLAQPERVREVVRRLEEVCDDDWHRQEEQRLPDATGGQIELFAAFEQRIDLTSNAHAGGASAGSSSSK